MLTHVTVQLLPIVRHAWYVHRLLYQLWHRVDPQHFILADNNGYRLRLVGCPCFWSSVPPRESPPCFPQRPPRPSEAHHGAAVWNLRESPCYRRGDNGNEVQIAGGRGRSSYYPLVRCIYRAADAVPDYLRDGTPILAAAYGCKLHILLRKHNLSGKLIMFTFYNISSTDTDTYPFRRRVSTTVMSRK